jgi:hypothetical protein
VPSSTGIGSRPPRTTGSTVPGVLRWLCALVVGAVVTGFAFLLITGHYLEEGPVLVSVVEDHGLHSGDVFVIAGCAVSILSLLVLVTPRRRRGPRRDGI